MALSLHSKYFYKTNLKKNAINFVKLMKAINFARRFKYSHELQKELLKT